MKDGVLQNDAAYREAKDKAAGTIGGIRPAINFIVDHANLYALKPLVMFDIAGLHGPKPGDRQIKVAVGAGLQLTVVVAKFETGYMRVLRPDDDMPRGNFVMRLVFQNLF